MKCVMQNKIPNLNVLYQIKKTMKTTRLFLALVAFVGLGIVMAGCSAEEDDDADRTSLTYKYTAAQLQEIADLQEEYGVTLSDLITESDAPLPTVEDMHALISLVASFQQAPERQIGKTNNGIMYSNGGCQHSMFLSPNVETYSGSKKESQTNNYGTFEFTVTWNNVPNTGGGGDVSVEVTKAEDPKHIWNIEYQRFRCSFSGFYGLNYTLIFVAWKNVREYDQKLGRTVDRTYRYTFNVSGGCNMSSGI